MLELLKSCRKGRRKLACAKLIVSFSLALMLAAALYIILSVSTSMILDLSGGDTTLMMLRTLHIYTFSQIDLQALGLLLLSGIACTLFAVFTSVIVKKPAVSLGLGMLFFLLPMLIAMDGLQTSWTSFFPSNFLSFRAIDQLMTTPWLAVLGNLYHRLPLLELSVYRADSGYDCKTQQHPFMVDHAHDEYIGEEYKTETEPYRS